MKSFYSSDTAESPRDFEFLSFSLVKTLGRTLVQGLERTGPGTIQRVVVSGGRDGIEFIERGGNLFIEMDGQLVQVRRVIGHTHPRVTGPSQGDLDALRMLDQTRSYIIEIGGESGGTLIRPR